MSNRYNLRSMSTSNIMGDNEDIFGKIDSRFENIEKKFEAMVIQITKEMKKSFMEEMRVILKEESAKVSQLESQVKMLQTQIISLKLSNEFSFKALEEKHEDLEQYGRRLCLRIDGLPTDNDDDDDESADLVLKKVEALVQEAECDIPSTVLDRAHRIGPLYLDKRSGKMTRSVIVRFSTFRHRTLFYNNRRKLKNNVSVKIDLTKSRYQELVNAMKLVEEFDDVKYVFADINCRLKVVMEDGSSRFFRNCEELSEILTMAADLNEFP